MQWLQSFSIKDDQTTIDVSFWHKTQEHLEMYSGMTLDQVVHVWTDTVKPKNKAMAINSNANPSAASTSPLSLNLCEGKVGHKVELGSAHEQTTMFRTAVGASPGGVVSALSIRQIVSSVQTLGNQRINLVVCVRKVLPTSIVNTKLGPTAKRTLGVFDAQGQEANVTIWGEEMCSIVENWTPMTTFLLLSGPQLSIYGKRLQITISYQTHIQINPVCKNVEWLRHYTEKNSLVTGQLNQVIDHSEVQLGQIQSRYELIDISKCIEDLGFLESVFGFCFVVICQLDIDNRGSDLLSSKCLGALQNCAKGF
ncbi:hypothetical protein BGZ94_009458 [Podila epigama]|nr:hypothetical protein BGZ94_009458 [Podila epigama]